jgi:hypothetical protein
MTRNLEIWNELAAISPAVADLGTAMPYAVPNDYFETLSEVIMARVHAGSGEETAVISVAGKATPFSVPDDYFSGLSHSIMSKIKAVEEISVVDELFNLSPVLASLKKENLYAVPDGYFEQLDASSLVHQSKKPATVVRLLERKTIIRLAAAASVVLMIAFGLSRFTRSTNQLDGYVKQGLKEYNTEAKLNQELENINEADLMIYLQNTSSASDVAIVTTLPDDSDGTTDTPEEEDALLESFMNQLDPTTDKTTTETN